MNNLLNRLTTILCLAALSALAQTTYYQDANREMYNLPSSAAMGQADMVFSRTGMPNENPGTLVLDTTSGVHLGYSSFFGDALSYGTLAYSGSLNTSTALALSINYLLIPDIINTSTWDVDEYGVLLVPPESEWERVSASETFGNLACSKQLQLPKGIQLGVGAAVTVSRLRLPAEEGEETGLGLGLDVGTTARFTRTGFRAGLLVRNLFGTYTRWSNDYSNHTLPRMYASAGWERALPYVYGDIRIGYVTPDLSGHSGVNAYAPADELKETSDAPRELHISKDPEFLFYGNFGLEYLIFKTVALRVGVNRLNSPAFGGGLRLFKQQLQLDFAYLPSQLSGSYLVSAGYVF